jgi:glycoside/pentoside/hexuronide:cation symporter, GPH family
MFALSAPAFPMAALTIPLVAFLPEYYANSLGLDLAAVGAVFMIVRLFDIAIDPVLGGLMDRTRSPWGRYKPWLVAGAPVTMLGAGFLMLAKPGVGPAYLLIWLLVAYIGFSLIVLAQLALTAAQTRLYGERAQVFGWWQASYTFGIIGVTLLPMLMGPAARNDRGVIMQCMAAFIILATPVTVAITCFGMRDIGVPGKRDHAGLREYFSLLRRRSTRILLSVDLLFGLATGMTSALGVMFYVAAKRVAVGDFITQLLIGFSVAILVAPVWARLATRIGKHRALALGAVVELCFYAGVAIVPTGQPHWIFFMSAWTGTGFAALNLLPRAMLADINDEELLEHGVDRNGLLYAMLTGIYKIGQAVAVGVVYSALSLIGFVASRGQQNSPQSLEGVVWMFSGVPFVLTFIGLILIVRYPLTAEHHAEIRKELDRRQAAAVTQGG